MEPEIEVCDEDEHSYDQTGRCNECGFQRNKLHTARRSGGAGAARQPLSDEDYRRAKRDLEETFE